MYWLICLLIICAVVALLFKIYCHVQIEIIEKKRLTIQFWLTISFMCMIPLLQRLKNTSAVILATRANAALCIFYSCILVALYLFY